LYQPVKLMLGAAGMNHSQRGQHAESHRQLAVVNWRDPDRQQAISDFLSGSCSAQLM
jgi:hypothetical protein